MKLKQNFAALAEKMSEGKDCGCDEHDDHAKCEDDWVAMSPIAEGEEKSYLTSGKEIKNAPDDGMSKADIVKKYVEADAKEEIEKLYALVCNSKLQGPKVKETSSGPL